MKKSLLIAMILLFVLSLQPLSAKNKGKAIHSTGQCYKPCHKRYKGNKYHNPRQNFAGPTFIGRLLRSI
jgi:hypothetical protein